MKEQKRYFYLDLFVCLSAELLKVINTNDFGDILQSWLALKKWKKVCYVKKI